MVKHTSPKETARRLAELKEFISQTGAGRVEQVRYCMKQFDVGERCAQKYVARVSKELAEDINSTERKEYLALQISRLEMVIREGRVDRCWPAVLGGIKELNTLLALAPHR